MGYSEQLLYVQQINIKSDIKTNLPLKISPLYATDIYKYVTLTQTNTMSIQNV